MTPTGDIAQAQILAVLKAAAIPVTLFGAQETTHRKVNHDLGKPDDRATKALIEFVGEGGNKGDILIIDNRHRCSSQVEASRSDG